MLRELGLLCVLSAVCLRSQAMPPNRALPSGVLPDGLGVNIHFTDPQPGEMKMLAAGGFTWVRMDFGWEGTEAVKGRYDFSAYDRLMAALEPHGIRPIFILDYVNRHYDDGRSPDTEDGRQGMARWAAAAVKHFRGRGILWEMYNEPNIGFWRPKVNPDDYVKLALAVGKAIREAAPDERYVGPAVSTMDFRFLETCFKAGLLNYWDAVTVHPYRSQPPETVEKDYRTLRTLIAKYAPKGKRVPIVSGEWGYSSVWNGMDPVKQGKMLPRQWLVNFACGVPLSIWYDWHDDGPDPKEPEHHFGTTLYPTHAGRDPIYDPKPAYLAARTLAAQLRGYRFDKRIDTGSPEDWVLLFTKAANAGDAPKIVAWTTASGVREVGIPASPGSFTVVAHDGGSAPSVTAARGLLLLKLTDAPQYVAPIGKNRLLQLLAHWERLPDEIRLDARSSGAIRCRVTNPLSETVAVTARLLSPVVGLTGGAEYRLQIRPGGDERWALPFLPTRSAEPQPVTVELNIAGYGRIRQTTHVVVTNPLSAAILAPAGDQLPVRVENPSGQEFRGVVELVQKVGSQRSVVSLPLEFARGETERVALFPSRAQPGSGPARLAVTIRETGAATSVTLPETTLRLVDDFARFSPGEDPDRYQVTTDGDAKVASKVALSAGLPPEGPPAPGMSGLRIEYQFDPGWKFLELRVRDPEAAQIEGKPKALGLWIFGDGQGNIPRLRFTDAAGQTFQPDAPAITWRNWRWVTMPMDGSGAGHWGGPDDGVVRYPIRWTSLFLLDSATRSRTEGTVYLAAPTLYY